MGLKLSISPKYRIRKINRNSVVHPYYVYQVRCQDAGTFDSFSRVQSFLQIQRWCQETFGDTMDYELFYYPEAAESEFFNPSWCYQTNLKERKYCIYLNEDAMTLFLLRWTLEV